MKETGEVGRGLANYWMVEHQPSKLLGGVLVGAPAQ